MTTDIKAYILAADGALGLGVPLAFGFCGGKSFKSSSSSVFSPAGFAFTKGATLGSTR
jgi:hypothetical protein